MYHRVDQALVPIAQVSREPSRGFLNDFRGPLSVLEVERFESFVFSRRVLEPARIQVSTCLSAWWCAMGFLHGHLVGGGVEAIKKNLCAGSEWLFAAGFRDEIWPKKGQGCRVVE